MKIEVNNIMTHCATGGKDFDPSLPTVLFLHGSGLDHRSWALQTRWFAFRNFSVLAPDFPGHSLSEGNAPQSIEESGAWLIKLLDAAGVTSAHVVGHSQGFLSALELFKQAPEKVKTLTAIGTGAAIPVNPALIETAERSAPAAAEMMLQWGFGSKMHMGTSPTPGQQPIAIGRHIMGNNPLATDLKCCAGYSGGAEVAETVNVPSLAILAGQDKMTPLKAGKALATSMKAQTHVLSDFGHMLPIEAPKQVLTHLQEFIVSNEA